MSVSKSAQAAGHDPAMPCPFSISFRGRVEPEWIDINGHMNVSWYDRLFDVAEKTCFETFGIGDNYIQRTGFSFFRLERFLVYEREALLDAAVEIRSRLLWTDMRRVHHFHELWNATGNYRAAHVDAISIHVDLNTRRSAPITLSEVSEPLRRLTAEQALGAFPVGVLRRVDGRRPS